MEERIAYGQSSLGYDLARFDSRSKIRQTVMEDEARAVHKPKAETRAAGISFGRIAVFFAFTAIALLIVFSSAMLSEISRTNDALSRELAAAKQERQVLTASLESRIKLDEIADIAFNKLGMIKPDRCQIVYIDLSGPEKVEYFRKTPWYKDLSNRFKDMLEYFA
ncbi:MAG: hypothetical protein FWH06_03160 [Oscillospiraceae bacterium]|nr:hypothetical protein [Oscillospiraceae bacterium]